MSEPTMDTLGQDAARPTPVARPDLRARADQARRLLCACRLCPRRCGVDRTRGQTGYCGLDAGAYWFRELVDYAEEIELIPAHAIYVTGCNMRCVFCMTGSWNADPAGGTAWDTPDLSRRVRRRRREGARTLWFVGGEPTLSLAAILDLVADVPDVGPVVWDSNMYFAPDARDLLRGVVDVYTADFKFGNNRCARDVADAPHYVETVTENLRFAYETATLIVRHLLVPGHLDCCCRPVLEWVGRELPGVRVSLRGNYMPPDGPTRDPALRRYVTDAEHDRACALAQHLGIALAE